MQVEWKQSLHLGQVWGGGLCGILKEAMGRADRKDYGQESNRGAWEGERIWRTGGVEWGAWGSRQRHLSEHPSSERQWELYLSDQHAFINTV